MTDITNNFQPTHLAGLRMISKIVCIPCGLIQEEPLIREVSSPDGGYHNSAYCSGCGKYIQHIRQSKPPVLRFGKYKGKRLSEVVKTDLCYLEWLIKQDIKEGTRKDITDVLLGVPV